ILKSKTLLPQKIVSICHPVVPFVVPCKIFFMEFKQRDCFLEKAFILWFCQAIVCPCQLAVQLRRSFISRHRLNFFNYSLLFPFFYPFLALLQQIHLFPPVVFLLSFIKIFPLTF